MALTGIDVSQWQGVIDWSKVKTDFVCIRSTVFGSRYPTHTDTNFEANWQAAKRYQIPVSAYYVFRPDLDAIWQVDQFLKAIDGKINDFEWVFDVELDGNGMSKAAITDKLFACIEHFTKYHDLPMIYTGAWFFNPKIERSELWQHHKLWIASYTSTPIIPFDWTGYNVWQYTNSGKVAGINGNVDMNKADDSLLFNKTDNHILKDDCILYSGLGLDAQVTGIKNAGSVLEYDVGYLHTVDGWLKIKNGDI